MNLRTFMVAALGVLIAGLIAGGGRSSAQTPEEWLVGSDADSGPGTLRWAIDEANASAGDDVIRFTSAMTIRPRTALPALQDDGIAIAASDGDHSADVPPRVWLDGSNAGDAAGLEMLGSAGTIQGLGIVGFERYGIGVIGPDATDVSIVGNWIGLRANGDAAPNLLSGVAVLAGASAVQISDNRIGGNSAVRRTGHGIVVGGGGTSGVEIEDNVIGIAADGSAAPNDDGILIVDAAQAAIRRNTIGNSKVAGIELRETRHPISVDGNRIGLRRDGGVAPNDVGVFLGPGSSGAQVGVREANMVSGNRVGIAVEQGAREARIESNWIGFAPPRGETSLTVAALPRAQIAPNRERGISVIAGAAEVRIVNNTISAGDFGIVVGGDDTSRVSLTRNVVAGARDGPTDAAIDVRGGTEIVIGGEFLGNDVCGARYGIRIAASEEVRVRANHVGAGAAERVTFDSDTDMRWGIQLRDGVKRARVEQNYIAEVSQAAISVVGADSQDNNLTLNQFGWNGIDIDLGADGVSDNDPRDRDRGPNQMLNRPVISRHDVDIRGTGIFNSTISGDATTGSYVEIYIWRDSRWQRIARSQRTDRRGEWSANTAVLPSAPIRALAITGAGSTSEFSDVFLPSQRVRLKAGVIQFAWTGPDMPIADAFAELERWIESVWRWDAAEDRWQGWSPKAPSTIGATLSNVRTGDVLRMTLSGRPPRDFFVPSGGAVSQPESLDLNAGFNNIAWLGGRVIALDTLERLNAASPGLIGTLWQWDGERWELVWPRVSRAWDPGRWEFPVFWLRATRDGTLGPP